ncbi:MAG: hypothetical protein M0Z35_15530 [Desulfitobacterium hafniense]|nr:hypothetical protein [Desulfitobacterium hafniense]
MEISKTTTTGGSSGFGVTIGIREIMDIVGGIVFLVSLAEVFRPSFPIDFPAEYIGAAIGIGVGYLLAWKRQRGR